MNVRECMRIMLASQNINTVEYAKIMGVTRQRALSIINNCPKISTLVKTAKRCKFKVYIESDDGSMKIPITIDESEEEKE